MQQRACQKRAVREKIFLAFIFKHLASFWIDSLNGRDRFSERYGTISLHWHKMNATQVRVKEHFPALATHDPMMTSYGVRQLAAAFEGAIKLAHSK
jgi:hypothetical protein